MAIAVTCTNCGVRLRFKAEHAGKPAKCRACEHPLTVQGQTVPDHDVFLSYSSKDVNVANAVCAALEAKKVRCWMAPRDVLPGKAWAGAILDAISDARVMVLIYSSNSNASPQVLREVDCAVTRNVAIIPFRIEAAAMSKEMQYYIAAAHWLDALDGAIDGHITKLVGAVRRLLNDQPVAESTLPAQPLAAPPRDTAQPARRSPFVWIGTVALTIVILVGVAWKVRNPNRQASVEMGGSQQAPGPTPVPSNVATPTPTPKVTPVAIKSAVPSSIPEGGAAPTSHPAGAIDLLAAVRLPQDVVGGEWSRTSAGIHARRDPTDAHPARLRINYQPPAEYDFSITFTRRDGIGQVLSHNGTSFTWNFGRSNNAGFAFVDNVGFLKNRTQVQLDPPLEEGKPHTSLVAVRNDSVSAYVDGKLVEKFATDYSDLSVGNADTVGNGCLGIFAFAADILSAELIPYKGDSPTTQTVANASAGTGHLSTGHLWVQIPFPDDARGGRLKIFVNGAAITGTPQDGRSHRYDFAVALHPNDIIVFRATSPFVNRYVRFAYTGGDYIKPFVGDTHDTTIQEVKPEAPPTSYSASVGQPTQVGNYPNVHREEWTQDALPEAAEPIGLPEKDLTYDILFKVPRMNR